MIVNRNFVPSHPRALLALQGLTFVLLVLMLVPILSGSKGILLLGAILAGISVLGLMQQPQWGVLLIFSAWFLEVDALDGVAYPVSAVLLIPLAMTILRERTSWVFGVPQIRIFLSIGFLFLISTWWSEFKYPVILFPEKDQTIRQLGEFFTHLGWLVFFLYFVTTRRKINVTVWLVVGLIVAAAVSAWVPFLKSGGAKRAAAAFSLAENSNRLAYISLFATSLLWFYRFHGQNLRWKAWTLPLLFLLPVTALIAGSRSGLLQMVTLAAFVIREQKGWSAIKRIYCVFFMGFIVLSIVALVPANYLVRATTFDSEVEAPGQASLQKRLQVVVGALKMVAADPVFGAGIGNYYWVAPTFFDTKGFTHNSYLWALAAGGIGVFGLYLLLFYVTYGMLAKLEDSGPLELRWLSKALKVNVVLFMIFSGFADFWLSDFLYLIVGLTTAMTLLWQREQRDLALTPTARQVIA